MYTYFEYVRLSCRAFIQSVSQSLIQSVKGVYFTFYILAFSPQFRFTMKIGYNYTFNCFLAYVLTFQIYLKFSLKIVNNCVLSQTFSILNRLSIFFVLIFNNFNTFQIRIRCLFHRSLVYHYTATRYKDIRFYFEGCTE